MYGRCTINVKIAFLCIKRPEELLLVAKGKEEFVSNGAAYDCGFLSKNFVLEYIYLFEINSTLMVVRNSSSLQIVTCFKILLQN